MRQIVGLIRPMRHAYLAAMDPRPRSHQERRDCALRYFAMLAARGAGYELRGVRGWAHADDVRRVHRGYRWGELLGTMAGAGHLDREPVGPPAARSPSYVYRISATGIREAGELLSTPLPPIAPPGLPVGGLRIHARPGERWALEALREAHRRGPKAHRMNSEPGWLTSAEMRAPAEAWNRLHGYVGGYRVIDDTDLLALVQDGLVEKAYVPLAWGRSTPVVMYRATEAGRTAELLEWLEAPAHPAADGPDR